VEFLPNKSKILRKNERKKKKRKRKKRSKDSKAKRKKRSKDSKGEKKKKIKFTSCRKRFYRKKERKEITFFYSTKSDVWPHPYRHIIYICTNFYSLTFPQISGMSC
jgi:hypothetical protein